MKKCGFSIHCHHDVLVEYCTDYKKRLDYIKSEKPNDERAIRLKCFKLLPRRALKDLPENLLKAYDDWRKADDDRQKADDDWRKAYDDWRKAYDDRRKADDDWRKAYDDWRKAYDDRRKADDDWRKAYDDWRKAY